MNRRHTRVPLAVLCVLLAAACTRLDSEIQTVFEEQSQAITLGPPVPDAGVAVGEDGYICLAEGADGFSLPLDTPAGDILRVESSFTQTSGGEILEAVASLGDENSLNISILSGGIPGNEGTLRIKIKGDTEGRLLYEGDVGIAYIDFNVALSEMTLPSSLSLNETFDPENLVYSISDAHASFPILARAANPAASVVIEDGRGIGYLNRVITPPGGDSTVLVQVQAPHGAVRRDYTIALNRAFYGIAINSAPAQRVYAVQALPNEGLNPAGMEVSVATASGAVPAEYTLAYDFTSPGIRTVTVSHKGASDVFTVWVVGLAGLSVSGPGGYAPDLSFTPAAGNYDLGTVPYTVESLGISAISGVAGLKGASLTIAGEDAVSGAAKQVGLAKGYNAIQIVTRLRNDGGDVSGVYTITVYRAALENGTEFFVSGAAKAAGGDGSREHPYAAVKQALDLVKNSGLESVPGSFVTITLRGTARADTGTSNALVDISGGAYPEIILKGDGTDAGVLDAARDKRVLYISGGARVSLGDNLILKGGNAGSSSAGGAVYVTGGSSLSMGGSAVIRDAGALHGGGVYVDGGAAFTMNGGTIEGNAASLYGGGVYVGGGGSFIMGEGALIKGNAGPARGGGVYVNGAAFSMGGGIIENNTASSGGGVYITGSSGRFAMSGGSIQENEGEGVYASGDSFTLNGGTITGNGGSGVYVSGSGFTMNRGTIKGNGGGGVYVSGSGFTMDGGTITGNGGSGVSVYGASGDISTFTMRGGTILGNTVNSSAINSGGGGVSVYGNKGAFTMNDGTIEGNAAVSASRGGGVFVSGGSFSMVGGTIQGNSTSSYGGGVHLYNASTTFHKTGGTITGSDASSGPQNTAGGDAQGHAVSVLNGSKIRTLTAGPDIELHYSGGSYAGGWD
jgi:hypothetical protein